MFNCLQFDKNMKKRIPKGKIKRHCLICGKHFYTIIYKGGKYSSGHYFSTLKIPIDGTGEYKKIGSFTMAKKKYNTVKWIGKEKKVEYWECNECYEEAGHRSWLEEKIEKLFGERCKDYESLCAVCQAWSVYDAVHETEKN